MGESVDLAVERAEREACERREVAQQEWESVEADKIDEMIDGMNLTLIFEALEKDEDWITSAQKAAQANAKEVDFAVLGRIIAHKIRDYAEKLVEIDNV